MAYSHDDWHIHRTASNTYGHSHDHNHTGTANSDGLKNTVVHTATTGQAWKTPTPDPHTH